MISEAFLSPILEPNATNYVGANGLRAEIGSGLHSHDLDVHVHSGIEVGIVRAGQEEMHYSSAVHVCGPGDVWLCSAWEPHGWRIADPATRNVVLFFPSDMLGHESVAGLPWLALFYPRPEDRPRVASREARARVLATASLMAEELERGRPGWENVVRLLLLVVLTEVGREWRRPLLPPSARPEALAALMPAMTMVHTTPWRRVAVGQAAESCGMGLSTFRRRFAGTMGLSFGEFCLRARLSAAAHGLLTTGKTIAAISREAGFVDDSHFRRHFRKHYGSGPAQYRRQHLPGG
jgi:AraC-like DNA-binding protein